MEKLNEFISQIKVEDRKKREELSSQDAVNKKLITKISGMVQARTSGNNVFHIDKSMIATYEQIFRYLNNDYTLEKEKGHVSIQPWNLDKGLILIGKFGRGKTLLLDLIYQNRTLLKITARYTTAFDLAKIYINDPMSFEKLTSGECSLFIDEIGDEPKETLNYGNAENVTYRAMKLFFDKVEKQEEKHRFFGTSNLGQNEIIERYGERIWSRIVGNCNIVIFGSNIKDYRK